jgi:sulfhydrogenase subunit beta (sulfur reductase)
VRASYLERSGLARLFDALAGRGFQIVGPTLRDGAIVYERIDSTTELPIGWTDEQDGGRYRLRRREDDAVFGYAVGPHSWKKFLFPPTRKLFSARKSGKDGALEILPEPDEATRYAFVGVRSCELHSIAIQDRVLIDGPYVDQAYRALRERAFLVAVNCVEGGGTCFCASMNTGPACESGYDLLLTEIRHDRQHGFVVEVGSDRGTEVLNELPHGAASEAQVAAARQEVERAVSRMGRRMDTRGIKELLHANYDHPRWNDVARRCLTCANCTMVCPTCFCTTVEDVTDPTGAQAERVRHLDSCFTSEFSYIHGGSIRNSPRSRYRQWLTHKLGTWIDQFGTSGCVGCGRCITWCPVGIDITEEVRAIRETVAPDE